MVSSSTSLRSKDERLDRVFSALGNRTRRAMLAHLASGTCSIGELAAPFEMSLPAASKHLRVLERAGLVRREVDGRIHRCSLELKRLREADQWLESYRAFWSGSLDALARYVENE